MSEQVNVVWLIDRLLIPQLSKAIVQIRRRNGNGTRFIRKERDTRLTKRRRRLLSSIFSETEQ